MKSLRKLFGIVLPLVVVLAGSVLLAQADALNLSGKVVETMEAGGYTYVKIENSGIMSWVAVPKAKFEVGQEVAFAPGPEMNNYESKTLKRKFDSIIFSSGTVEKAK